MYIGRDVRQRILRTFSPQKANPRKPLVEPPATHQYYVAGMVGHPETGEAAYALLKLRPNEIEQIMGLDRRLAHGDQSVREARRRFFDSHRDGCLHAVGRIDRCGLGDVLPPGEVSFTPCAGARARILDFCR
jgi:hypothetical protein